VTGVRGAAVSDQADPRTRLNAWPAQAADTLLCGARPSRASGRRPPSGAGILLAVDRGDRRARLCAFKPNSAFFERFGAKAGGPAEVIAAVPPGIPVILTPNADMPHGPAYAAAAFEGLGPGP
jgi:hypothetical protein